MKVFSSAKARFIFYALIITACSPFLLWRARARRNAAYIHFTTGTPRILIIPILSRVGDIVCSTPVFREIKESFPHARLAVVVAHKVHGILKNNPRIDDLIDFNNPRFWGFMGRGRFFLDLFLGNYDAVFGLGRSPLGTFCGLASAAPIRVKTIVPRPSFFEYCTDWLNTHCALYQPSSFLQKHYVSLLSAIGIHSRAPVTEVFTDIAGEKKAHIFVEKIPGGVPRLLVGMTVSAGNKIKEWPLERFAGVADALVEQYSAKVLFIDSSTNRTRAEETLRRMQHGDSAAVVTEFSLEELPSLIKALSIFIAVDTGTIYIAHALGVPLIDIIGPVHPGEQPPSDEKSIQVLPKTGIAPSSFVLTLPLRGAEHSRAVLSIAAQDVVTAFEQLMARGCIRPAAPYEKNP